MRRHHRVAPLLRTLAAGAAALLMAPTAGRASGVVPMPLPLETVVRRASVVVVGRTLGTRDVPVQVPIAETGLPPGDRTHLAFTVRQVGIRVDEVIGGAPRDLVKVGTELWLTDPGGYELGFAAERAELGFVAQEVYQPRAPLAPGKPGTRVIAFAETSADRAARGAKVAGLLDGWWQAAAGAFETPARRREVERLRRSGRRGRER